MPAILYTYQTITDISADAETIKGLNIDVVMNYYYTNEDSTIASAVGLLDAYQTAGLKGLIRLGFAYTQKIMTAGDFTALGVFITALKDHPALYGWYTNDEPALSGSSVNYPNGQILTVYSFIKNLDPIHPCVVVYPGYGAGFWPSNSGVTTYPYGAGNQDIFGIDTYPIGSTGTYSLTSNRAGFQAALANSLTNVTDRAQTLFVLQTYVDGVGLAYPSGDTIADMAADAKAAGWTNKGIAFWMWAWYGNASVSCLKQNPAAWDAVRTIASLYRDGSASFKHLNGTPAGVLKKIDGSPAGILKQI